MIKYKTLVVIPARAGSKIIPQKNIRILAGKPLLAYAIEAAKKSNGVDKVVVSTESDWIADIAKHYGAEIVKRPIELAKDDVTLDPVIFHALKIVEEKGGETYQFVITINPTSPLLSSKTIEKAINIMRQKDYDTLISVKNDTHLYWKKQKRKFIFLNEKRVNRQYLEPIYRETGALLISRREVMIKRSRIGRKIFFLKVPLPEAIDIDSYQDWWLAEKMLKRRTILFRVDGNSSMGLGHVYRAITIARQLNVDHSVVFLMTKKNKLGIRKIKENNYRIFTFSNREEELAMIDKINPHIVINDILDTDAAYIHSLKQKGYFVVNFEDLGKGAAHADIVINALYKTDKKLRNHYYGYRYYCSREEFSIFPKPVLSRQVKVILVTFGGVDTNDLTARTLKAIEFMNMKEMHINIVLGLGYAHWGALNTYVKRLKAKGFRISLKRNVKIMVREMKKADVIVTSNGRTVYEAGQLAIPCISIAQNAREEKHPFISDKTAISYLGKAQDVSENTIASAFRVLISNYSLRKRMHLSLKKLKLHTGTDRVIRLIFQKYYSSKGKRVAN
jgi:CMP-N-acetylneuraminic acid synthetase/spore coat polysaccharide biosynthesis predicted glycosyltransferase SpsG